MAGGVRGRAAAGQYVEDGRTDAVTEHPSMNIAADLGRVQPRR